MHNILTDCYAYSKETFSKTARLNCPPGSRSSVPGALEETKKECDPAKTCHNLKMLLAAMRNSALLLLLFNAVGHGAASDRVEEMGQIDGSQTAEYGFGASYPINSYSVSQSDLPDKQAFYDDLMDGCRKSCQYCTELCNDFEKDRIAMSIRQPQSMQNYTDLGIMKIRAPESLMKLLTKFWEDNKGLEYPEEWGKGNVYVNHWEMPSYMLSCEDEDLKGGGPALRTALWDAAIDTVSEWTGQALTTSSLYGIRVYKEGAVLAPHVDRMPLVSSAIINVAQDVDEPWPLEVYTHDGKIHNITMEPGDLVLYESHSVIHGRPFSLKGRYFANVFIHFMPEFEDPNKLPSYIVPDSPEAKKWEAAHNKDEKVATEAHTKASLGDLGWLERLASSESRQMLFEPDYNGWTPFHEAARTGKKAVLNMLLEEGVDVNHPTEFGEGDTPLSIAIYHLGRDNPAVEFLVSRGGKEFAY